MEEGELQRMEHEWKGEQDRLSRLVEIFPDPTEGSAMPQWNAIAGFDISFVKGTDEVSQTNQNKTKQ